MTTDDATPTPGLSDKERLLNLWGRVLSSDGHPIDREDAAIGLKAEMERLRADRTRLRTENERLGKDRDGVWNEFKKAERTAQEILDTSKRLDAECNKLTVENATLLARVKDLEDAMRLLLERRHVTVLYNTGSTLADIHEIGSVRRVRALLDLKGRLLTSKEAPNE